MDTLNKEVLEQLKSINLNLSKIVDLLQGTSNVSSDSKSLKNGFKNSIKEQIDLARQMAISKIPKIEGIKNDRN